MIHKILCKIITVFTISIILRYIINEYIDIPNIEYLDCILIFISYIINSLLIEPYIYYDIYDYNLDKSEVKKLWIKGRLKNLI